jgi:MFS family permease
MSPPPTSGPDDSLARGAPPLVAAEPAAGDRTRATPDEARLPLESPPARSARGPGGPGGLPRNVVALGFVSLLTDVSTEMIVPVLPLFVVGVLKASMASVGVIEGVAESTAALMRLGSGWLSDRTGRRKPFLFFGYGISAVAKAALAAVLSWPMVLLLRFSDRVGKGLRNPPRDALIAESVEPRHLGRAFGFHRGLDTLGAAIGPLVAFALLGAFPGGFRLIFLCSAVPAALSLAVLAAFVRARRPEPARARAPSPPARAPGGPFRRFLLVAGVFSLANSSTAFMLLLAADPTRGAGFTSGQVTLVYLLYNLVYALLSWPVGEVSDRIGRRPILLAAYLLFAGLYALLAWRTGPVFVIAGFVLLGLHSALLEASQRSMLSDLVEPARRGTAYGLYYTVVGVALLPASIVAGALWDRLGPRVMFGVDAALALVAALLFALLLPSRREYSDRHGHAG